MSAFGRLLALDPRLRGDERRGAATNPKERMNPMTFSPLAGTAR